ncbi:HEAT repeat domain-containing protein [Candidatus Poribacteria bacterium]
MITIRNWRIHVLGLVIVLCVQAFHTSCDIVEAVDPIARSVNALAGQDAVARFMAEEQLVEMGDAAVSALEPLATSSGFTPARQYSINILARIGSEQSVQLLLRILEQEPDVHLRALICRHLGRMGVKEAVPIIGKWLFTIQGKPFNPEGEPQATNTWYAWAVHSHALRKMGCEDGIPILEKMLTAEHGGRAGRSLLEAYKQDLGELKQEATFWKAVRRTPGLESHAKLLFRFFRRDTLALIRLYRDKVVRLGLEGRWVLEDMGNYPDEELRQAAKLMLKEYDRLRAAKDEELGTSDANSREG